MGASEDKTPSTEGSAAQDAAAFSTEEVLALLSQLLCDFRPGSSEDLARAQGQCPALADIVSIIMDLRELTAALSKGDFQQTVPSRGYVVSNLKALQSNLRHLVWQMKQLAQGDYSQRIDFLGNVSESFNAMTEMLHSQNIVLQEMAQYDSLTKLANRQYLSSYLDGLFSNALNSERTFSLLMVDIDLFKAVNDAYGHDAGDIVLQAVASYLTQIFRSTDFISRYGGEEFIVVLPDQPLDIARRVTQRALEYFEGHPIQINESLTVPVTVSIGISEFSPEDGVVEQVIKRSDTALYLAKHNGRNRLEVVTHDGTPMP